MLKKFFGGDQHGAGRHERIKSGPGAPFSWAGKARIIDHMTTPPAPPTHWTLYGHHWAVDFVRQSMAHGRTRHAYLITGTPQIGKSRLAHLFAMALNCEAEEIAARPCFACPSCKRLVSGNHPDLIYAENDARSGAIKINTVREVIRLLALKPFASRYRVALFYDFDLALGPAQDALLKTLEEPPPHAVLLVVARAAQNLLSTITSRCQQIPLRPLPTEDVHAALLAEGAEETQAELLARLSSGRIGWALEALHQPELLQKRGENLDMLREIVAGTRALRFEKAQELDTLAGKDKLALREILETWQTYWRDVLLLALNSPIKPCNVDRLVELQQLVQRIRPEEAEQALRATRTMIEDVLPTNASPRLALEVLFLDYPGLRR